MSLKRKAPAAHSQDASSKKAKASFFAPRTTTGSPSQARPLFVFPEKREGSLRLTTWNVNGIKSVDEKVLKKYLEAEDPDILVLTETKYGKGKPDILCLKARYKVLVRSMCFDALPSYQSCKQHQVWGADAKAGHGEWCKLSTHLTRLMQPRAAGTAILSKHKPKNIVIGMPTWPGSSEETTGRFIQLEFENTYVVGTYVPNSGENFKSMDTKQKWNTALKEHLESLDPNKPYIWAGDFNCIPSKKDLDQKAQTFWNELAGLSEVERGGLDAIVNPIGAGSRKLKDAWRHLHPDGEEFTHSSSKYGAWRLDSFILPQTTLEKVQSCEIRHELKDLKLSDHWPVTLDFLGPL